MAEIYTLRDPNYTIPTEIDEMIAQPASVDPFVALKAAGGTGTELIRQIRDLASLPAFDQGRFDQFCEGCNVTEDRRKTALRNLLNVLKTSDLELVNNDEVMPVNQVH